MRRFVNYFRSPRDAPITDADASPSAPAPTPPNHVEYTDGSDSYSYEEPAQVPPLKPPSPSRPPPSSIQPSRKHPEPSPRQEQTSRRRPSDRDSESSHYNLRSAARRAQKSALPSAAKAPSEGSMSQRDMKRSTERPLLENVKPRDDGPRLAIPTLPHYGSARTTSGVLGHPGRVTTVDIENATHSALRTFCAELGVPAVGTKAELQDRALRNLSRKQFQGEEVQRLESKQSQGASSSHHPKPTPAPSNDSRRETITTTARGSASKKTLNATSSAVATDANDNGTKRLPSKEVPSSAELSSTALFKSDTANSNGNGNRDRSKRLAFRGTPSIFDSQSAQNRNPPPSSKNIPAGRLALPPLSGLGGSVTATPVPMGPSGSARRPPAVPPSATAASDASRPRTEANVTDFVSPDANADVDVNTNVNSSRHQPRDRTAPSDTHLHGIRLVDVERDQHKVELPAGVNIDKVSPAGRKLPAIFAGAQGGPSSNHTTPKTAKDDNRNAKSNLNGNSRESRPPVIPSPNPSGPTAVTNSNNNRQVTTNASKTDVTPIARSAQPTAPTLPPIRPAPKRGSNNGFATPADIVRTFNRYPPRQSAASEFDRPPNASPSSKPEPLFRQGARPSSERFGNIHLNRVRDSAFNELASPMDKRASTTRAGMIGPFSNSLFSSSPANRRNKRHSTGMASFSRGRMAGSNANDNSGYFYGSRLNDLRKDLGHLRNEQQTPGLVSLKNIHATDKWRRNEHQIAMASSARKILAAIRKTSEENRRMCANRKPLPPLGPPPSLKRARDEEEEPIRKRTRREGPATRTTKPSGEASNSRSIPFDFGFSPKIIRPSRNEDRITNEAKNSFGNRTPSKSALKRRSRNDLSRSDGFNRTLSIPGSADRKRRLGPQGSDDSAMKQRSSKRRSLSFAAVAAVKKAVQESENATTPPKETPKKAVTFSQQLEKPSEFFGDGPPKKNKNPFTHVPEIEPETRPKPVVPLQQLETEAEKNKNADVSKKPAFSFAAPVAVQPPSEAEKQHKSEVTSAPKEVIAIADKTPAPEPVALPSFNFGAKQPTEKPSSTEKEPTFSFKIPPPAPVEPEKEAPVAPATSDAVSALEKPAVLPTTTPAPAFSFGSKSEITDKKAENTAEQAPAPAFTFKAPAATTPLNTTTEEKVPAALPASKPVAATPNIFAAPANNTDAPTTNSVESAAIEEKKIAPVFPFSKPVASKESDPPVAVVDTTSASVPVFTAPEPTAATTATTAPSFPSAKEPTFGTLAATTSSFAAPSTSAAIEAPSFGALPATSSTPFGSSAAGSSALPNAFGASAPAVATGSSSNAFDVKPASTTPFGGSGTSTPFGTSSGGDKTASTPAGPFGTGSNAFGSSSAALTSAGGFGTPASNPFAAPAPSQGTPFGSAPAFGADSTNSGGPFNSFGTPQTANATSNPFAPPSSGFGASVNTGPAKPFIFSSAVPSQTSNPPAGSLPFGNGSSSGFGAGNNAAPANNSNPFGNTPSFGSGNNNNNPNANPFGSNAATAPAFGQFNASNAAPAFGAAPQGAFGAPQQAAPNMFDAPLNGGNNNNQFNIGARTQRGTARGRKFVRARRTLRR